MFRKIFITVLIVAILFIIGYLIYTNISFVDDTEEIVSSSQTKPSEDIIGDLPIYLINTKNGELEKEVRNISLKKLNSDPYNVILNELKTSSKNSNLITPLPISCTIISVNKNGDTLTLELSDDFIKQNTDNNMDKLILQSIVTTITNLKEINNIKFVVNNSTDTMFGQFDLSKTFSNKSFE